MAEEKNEDMIDESFYDPPYAVKKLSLRDGEC